MAFETWQKLRSKFDRLLHDCESAKTALHYDSLCPCCKEAGRPFFDLLKDGTIELGVDETFKVPPAVEKDVFDQRTGKCVDVSYFDNYWLCVLGAWGRADKITVGHRKLRNTRIPTSGNEVRWAACHHIDEVANSFFVDDNDYICEVSRASVRACDVIIDMLRSAGKTIERKGQPPEGYLNFAQIKKRYGVPRTTVKGWQEKANGEIHKRYKGKNYYPQSWVDDQFRNYKPRRRKG
jgi:hypothetical protein